MTSIDLSSMQDSFASYYGTSERDSGAASLLKERVVGRDSESLAVLKAYHNVLRTKQAQTVLVHGNSGSGKTALVDTMRATVCNTNGYFVAGKYFQNSSVQEPYSAIMAAFSDLCDLVIQSDDFDEETQREIATNLGSDAAQLLAKSISNLAPIVGEMKGRLEVEASFTKFKVACRTFLCAISSEKHPVVVFLDDVQWADDGSAQLIQMFLQDSDLKNVLFLLAYRDEDAAHVVENVIGSHLKSPPTDIALSNLDEAAVHQMVTYIMESEDVEPNLGKNVQELSALVAKRTSGNPLHVLMFMEAIEREDLLTYDCREKSWIFDVQQIQQIMMTSETVADLLARKIERISSGMKETLKIASLMGYEFAESILLNIASTSTFAKQENEKIPHAPDSTRKLVQSWISGAVEEGFIDKTSDGYQFTHDKLQTAFRALIGESEKGNLHLLIGEAFLAHEEEESSIYRAAVHLNAAPGFLDGHREKSVRLAHINLQAAKYCNGISAFGKAAEALLIGLRIFDSDERWGEEYFALTFEMMELLARMQLLVGDFETCKEMTLIALQHGRTPQMKLNLLLINVEVRMAAQEIDDALATAHQALQTLGVKMPQNVKVWHVATKLLKVKSMLSGKTNESILNLPAATDPVAVASVKLLMHICLHGLLKEKKDTAVYSALLALEWTLRNGLSQHSSGAFAMYGITEVFLGNIDRGYRFGKLAIAMLDRVESPGVDECATVSITHSLLSCWKEPFEDLVEPLYRVAKSGFQNGNLVYGTHCLSHCYSMHFHMGTNLKCLENMLRVGCGKVSDLGQDSLLLWLNPILQNMLNMQRCDGWDDICVLSGDIMNEGEFFRSVLESNNTLLFSVAMLWKGQLAVDFEQWSTAATMYQTIRRHDTVRTAFGAPMYYFYEARLHYGLFDISGKRTHHRQARKYLKLLRRMHTAGCPNASPRLVFLEALEAAAVARKRADGTVALSAAYGRGIDSLAESKYFHLEGLLNERAGFDFARRGLRRAAERYFRRALHLYEHEWGATAKFNQLQEKSAEALEVGATPIDVRHNGKHISIDIDAADCQDEGTKPNTL
mmetsp:Transcript_2209/g.3485  ORF Transcript_2209/g.3485 Transcript_2209/m.3485 type:complete len:1071 (+) Transcript_2209:110-3322(+)